MAVARFMNSSMPESPAGKSESRVFLRGTMVVQCLIILLLALDVMIFYGIFLSPQGILGYREQSRQVAELNAKILKLREDNHKLFHRIQSFKSDPSAQEKLVREQLGWVRPNELMIEFVRPRKDKP